MHYFIFEIYCIFKSCFRQQKALAYFAQALVTLLEMFIKSTTAVAHFLEPKYGFLQKSKLQHFHLGQFVQYAHVSREIHW